MARYAGVAAGIIAVAAVLLALAFDAPVERRSIAASAVLAFVVQLAAFGGVALASREQVMVGWGLGVLARFVVLAGYALLVVQAVGLAPAAALISLATFFFLCTLVEPLVLRS